MGRKALTSAVPPNLAAAQPTLPGGQTKRRRPVAAVTRRARLSLPAGRARFRSEAPGCSSPQLQIPGSHLSPALCHSPAVATLPFKAFFDLQFCFFIICSFFHLSRGQGGWGRCSFKKEPNEFGFVPPYGEEEGFRTFCADKKYQKGFWISAPVRGRRGTS